MSTPECAPSQVIDAFADVPVEYIALTRPHKNVVTRRDDNIESYVRWQQCGGALTVTVPFPVGACLVRKKMFRVGDHMPPRDVIRHAQELRRTWSKRSLELRAKYVSKDRAARMRPPDSEGLLGSITFREPTHSVYVIYVDAAGHRAQKTFSLPRNPAEHPEQVRAAVVAATDFVRDMLARGVETPIRRKFVGITGGHRVHPITMYFAPEAARTQ